MPRPERLELLRTNPLIEITLLHRAMRLELEAMCEATRALAAAPANDDIRQHRFDELKATNTDPRLGDAALADMARGYRPLLPPLVARLEGLANIVSSPQIREAKLHEA